MKSVQVTVRHVVKVPIEKGLATLCDQGMIELFKGEWFSDATIKMEGFIE